MKAPDIHHMFRSLTFTKTASEIISAVAGKAQKVTAKIEERQTRVAALRKEYGIDDAALVQLLTAARKQSQAMSYTYTSNVPSNSQMQERSIGAGVVNNLLTENDFIEAEKDQVATLELIARNLKPIPRFADDGTPIPPAEFTLSQDELEYLGF